jgi:hypothetical protein
MINRKQMKLYWVTTEDHHEDWFIVASTPEEASKLHEELEGYEIGDASSQEILSIPENISTKPGWPSDELLFFVGATFIQNGDTRIVEISGVNGKQFVEGMLEATIRELDDDIFELLGEGRLNKTNRTGQTKH